MVSKKRYLMLYTAVTAMNILLLMRLWTQEYEALYSSVIVINTIILNVYLALLVHYNLKHAFFVFDPIYFVTLIYAFMFHIAPIYDVLCGELLWFGYDLFPYGIKASLIAAVGYFAFYIAYSYHFTFGTSLGKRITQKKPKRQKEYGTISATCRKKRLVVAYIMYIVSLSANIYYMRNSGFGSIKYILTLGMLGTGGSESTAVNNIGFVSMLSYSLPAIVMMIWEYSDHDLVDKIINFVLFSIMFLLQVARGFRFFIVQIVVSFIAFYCIRNHKKLKLNNMLVIGFVSLTFILIMTLFRDSIRRGGGMNLSEVNWTSIQYGFDMAFWDNLRIYQNFYGMVHVIPERFGFVGIRQLVIGTLVMVIPRMLWPGKISSYGGEGLRVLIGSNIGAGQAYPALGEYYYAMGTVGVVICMAVFAVWLKNIKTKYMESSDPLDIIHFSIALGCCLQLIIRGYFPSNFWYLIFALLPVWMIKTVK